MNHQSSEEITDEMVAAGERAFLARNLKKPDSTIIGEIYRAMRAAGADSDLTLEECAKICDAQAKAFAAVITTFSDHNLRIRAEGMARGAEYCARAIRSHDADAQALDHEERALAFEASANALPNIPLAKIWRGWAADHRDRALAFRASLADKEGK